MIKERIQLKQMSKFVTLREEDISDEMVVQEYFDIWRESFVNKDKLKIVLNHPGLLKDDYVELNRLVDDYKIKKLTWAVGGTALCWVVYNVGFKSNWIFYNFFNKRHRFAAVGWLKKTVGLYSLFTCNVLFFNYIFDHQMQVVIDDKNYIKKYKLNYVFNTMVE